MQNLTSSSNSPNLFFHIGHSNSIEQAEVHESNGPIFPEQNCISPREKSEEINDSARYKKQKVVRIFSADGGGVRTLFSIKLAAKLERDLGKDIKLGNIFDVFAGTSAGAISALGLTKRSDIDPEQPAYNAQTLDNQFPEFIGKVFPMTYYAKTLQYSRLAMDYPQYDKEGLIAIADHYAKNTLLKDALKEVVVPTYQPCDKMRTWYITRHLSQHNAFFADLTMKKLLLMTTAAPTYFEPEIYKGYRFNDGGLFANNPSLAAWTTARHTYGPSSKYVICAFGTGISPTKYDTDPKCGTGIYSLAPYILDLLMNASEQGTNQIMKQNLGTSEYFRIQKIMKYVDLSDSSPATLKYLDEQAKEYLDDEKNHENWEIMLKKLQPAENDEEYAQPIV